jgi:hypothetical protein
VSAEWTSKAVRLVFDGDELGQLFTGGPSAQRLERDKCRPKHDLSGITNSSVVTW